MKFRILNPVTLFLSLLAGLALIVLSLIFTWKFFITLAPGTTGIFFGIFGVVNDFGKVILLPAVGLSIALYFDSRKKSYLAKGLYFASLWIICFAISLVASQGFDLNKKNEIKNEAIKNSTTYKTNTEAFQMNKNSAESLQKEISELKATKDKKVKESSATYQKQYDDAKKKYYIDTPLIGTKAIQAKMIAVEDKTKKEIDSQIAKKEAELSQTKANVMTLNKDISNASANVETTEGLIAFSQWLSSIFKSDPDKLIGYFYIVKNIFGEFLGLGLLMLGCLEITQNSPKLRPTSPSDKPKKKLKLSENDSHLTPKNLSGNLSGNMAKASKLRLVQPIKKDKKFNEKVQRYMDNMENPKEKNICFGYQKIAKLAGLTDNEGKEIYGYLKNKGIIEVIDGKTKIIRKDGIAI